MTFKKVLFIVTLFASPAYAEGVVGTWSTKDGCDRLAAMSADPNAAWIGDFESHSYLDKFGIDGYEWGCKFIQQYSDDQDKIVALSTCHSEGEYWPELIMLEPLETGWAVITKGDKQPERFLYDTKCTR